MWTRKSPQELAIELLGRRMAQGASALFLAFLIIVTALPGGVLNIMPSARVVAGVLAVLLLLGWRGSARGGRAKAMYCEQCQSVKADRPQSRCVCGGNLTPLREMKWVEESARQSDSFVASSPEKAMRMSRAV